MGANVIFLRQVLCIEQNISECLSHSRYLVNISVHKNKFSSLSFLSSATQPSWALLLKVWSAIPGSLSELLYLDPPQTYWIKFHFWTRFLGASPIKIWEPLCLDFTWFNYVAQFWDTPINVLLVIWSNLIKWKGGGGSFHYYSCSVSHLHSLLKSTCAWNWSVVQWPRNLRSRS